MANEFKIKNGLVVLGDTTISGAATVGGNSVIHTGNIGSYAVTTLSDTLATVTGRGATTTSGITVGSLSSTGNINLNGGTLSFNTNYFSITNGGVLQRNGGNISLVTDGTAGLTMYANAGSNKVAIHTQLLLPQSTSALALANSSATDLGLKFYASSLMIFIAGGQDIVKIGTGYFATNVALTFGSQSSAPYINYNGNHLLLNAGTLTTTGYISIQTGNLLIGTTTDSGYKLDVNGTGRFAQGLTIDYNGINIGGVSLVLSPQGSGTISSSNSVGNASTYITMSGPAYYSPTSGVAGTFAVTGQSYMASGTATFNTLTVAPIVNNTATYSGIFRGLYYNPTLTSLTGTTHRAIETTSGDVIFGSTSGNIGLGTSSPTTYMTEQRIFAISGGPGTQISMVGSRTTNDILGTISFWNSTSRVADINSIRYNSDTSGAIRFRVADSGSLSEAARIVSNGNVLINTTTDSGYKLDVNGTARFSGQVKFDNSNIIANGITSQATNFQISRANTNTSVEIIGGATSVKFDATSGSAATQFAGQVSIGSTYFTPSYMLDVSGTGRFSSSLTANSFVKSGGTSWDYLKGDGSVTTVNATSDFVRYGDYINYPTFANKTVTLNPSVVKSLLWGGNNIRYTVTDTYTGTYPNAGSTWIKTYELIDGTNSVYSSGNVYLGFWVNRPPANVTVRVQNTSGTWYGPYSGTEIRAGGSCTTCFAYWRIPCGGPNYIKKWEITLTPQDGYSINLQTVDIVIDNNEGIDQSPFVGRGGSSIYGTLSFIGSGPTTNAYITNGGVIGGLALKVANNTGIIEFQNSGGTKAGSMFMDSSIWRFKSSNSYDTLNIFANGNLGIKQTTDSGYTLDVAGDIRSTANIRSNNGTVNNILSWTSEPAGVIGTSSNHPEVFWTNGTEKMRITTSGNVGIGTSSPTDLLTIYATSQPILSLRDAGVNANYGGYIKGYGLIGAGGQINIGVIDNNTYRSGIEISEQLTAILFRTSASQVERMRITSAGNVGIGTSSPSYKLQVNADGAGLYVLGANTAPYNQTIASFVYGGNSNSINIENQGGKASIQARSGASAMDLQLNPIGGNVGINTTSPGQKLQINSPLQTEYYGTDNSSPADTMNLVGTGAYRGLGTGSALLFSVPANTDGSNMWAQARILGTGDNASNGNAEGAMFLQTRALYNPGVGGSWNWRTNMVLRASGNVGIGTTNPTAALHIAKPASIAPVIVLQTTDSTSNGFITWKNSSGTQNVAIGTNYNIGDTGAIEFISGNTTNMILRSSGNLGIGTTSPSVPLQVGSSVIGASGGSPSILASAGLAVGTGTRLSLDENYYVHGYLQYGPSAFGSETSLGIFGYYGISLGTRQGNGALVVRGDSNNVGIGTSSPAYKLDVAGTISNNSAQNIIYSSYDAVAALFQRVGTYGSIIQIGRSGVSNSTTIDYPADGTFAVSTAGSERMRITSGGNVGIGTTQPVGQLNIFGGTGNNPAILTLQSQSGGSGLTGIYFRPYQNVTFANTAQAQASILAIDSSYSAHITFSTKVPGAGTNSLTERMRLTSTGNLLIGTTTDTGEALQVTGSIKSTALSTNGPVVASGGVLTSVAGYTGMVTIQQTPPMPPITFDIQNGIIVNVM